MRSRESSHGARSTSSFRERQLEQTQSPRGGDEEAADRNTLEECVGRLSRRLGHTGQLTAKAHESAVRLLTDIRDRIMSGEQTNAACDVLLVCCGVSVERRRLLTADRDELRDDLLRTSVLIFVTICLVEHQRRGRLEDDEADKHILTLQRASSASLWRRVMPAKKDGAAAAPSPNASNLTPVAVLDPTAGSGSASGVRPWSEVLDESAESHAAPPSDGDVAYSAICSGVMLLESTRVETFEALSEMFYRHTALDLAASSLRKASDADFLSLSAAAFCGAVNTDGVAPAKCKALIAAGESEAGQQVCCAR
jgi:hypothetical protein